MADTVQAEALDSSAVDTNRASRPVGVVAGENTIDCAVSIGGGFVLEATALRLANCRCLVAFGSNVLESAVDVTAFSSRESSIITLLTKSSIDDSITARV